MRKCLLILATCTTGAVACTTGAVACAQSAPPASMESGNNVTREQRRTELRTILQAYRQWEPTATPADAAPVERHLTDQDRAEIRRQLRQHRPEKVKTSP